MSTCHDFRLHHMLDKLMEDFVCPISEGKSKIYEQFMKQRWRLYVNYSLIHNCAVFLAEFGGSTLDCHLENIKLNYL